VELKPFDYKVWSGAEKRGAEHSQTPPKYFPLYLVSLLHIFSFIYFVSLPG
jgi:hypothetical protein